MTTEHHGVHKNLFQKCPCIPGSNWNLEILFFEERGKPEYLEKNLSEKSREQQQTGRTYDAGSGNRTRKHWWEASALTTTPSLLPYFLVHPSHSYKPWHKSSCLSVLLLLECPQKFRQDTSCKWKNLLALSYQT